MARIKRPARKASSITDKSRKGPIRMITIEVLERTRLMNYKASRGLSVYEPLPYKFHFPPITSVEKYLRPFWVGEPKPQYVGEDSETETVTDVDEPRHEGLMAMIINQANKSAQAIVDKKSLNPSEKIVPQSLAKAESLVVQDTGTYCPIQIHREIY